jgi:hypothetical protein
MLIFFEKKGLNLKKSLGATEFYEKLGQKNQNFVVNSKLSHFDKNLSLNHNLIYCETRGHSELARREVSSKDNSQYTNLYKRCAASSRFRTFRNELAANKKIEF